MMMMMMIMVIIMMIMMITIITCILHTYTSNFSLYKVAAVLLLAVPYRYYAAYGNKRGRRTSNAAKHGENIHKKKDSQADIYLFDCEWQTREWFVVVVVLLRSFHRSIIGRFENTWTPVRVHFGVRRPFLFFPQF